MKNESAILDQILKIKGHTTKKQKEDFLNFDYEKDLHDPNLLSGVKKAVKIISKAIEEKNKIAIYGDYDADGVCASTVVYETLLSLEVDINNIIIYIPNRNDDGYGMNIESLKSLKEKGVELIITVDLGSTNIEETKWIKENGLKIIITDHHIVHKETPKADAFINPHKKNSKYPFKQICGAMVAFKLCVALISYQRENNKKTPMVGWEKWLLDVVAIATVADVMPLLDENRTVVKYGLFVLSQTKRKGITNLLDLANIKANQIEGTIDTTITAENIGFLLAPRINAAGRIDDAMIAFKTITSKDEEEAKRLALTLDSLNNKRKDEVNKILKKIKGKKINDNSAIVQGDKDWMLGVVGIVAGRLSEMYNKPSFIYQVKDDLIIGSARTPEHFNTIDILSNVKNILIKFGGHKQAGGFTVKSKDEEEFISRIQQTVSQLYEKENNNKKAKEDMILNFDDISLALCSEIEKLEPCGQNNNEPLFLINNVRINNLKLIGETKKHLRCFVACGNKSHKAIYFNSKDEIIDKISNKDTVDIFFNLQKDEYNGYVNVLIKIIDIIYDK